ncbi:MAG TPA: phytoene/squalene synthase family protein [Bauldia sp.]|nr:phytoene/squalene synthase family protein [Bauldia sp.]
MAERADPLAEAYARAAETVRAQDNDRYVADLFAPEPLRQHLFALHAFSAEIARVREVVSDPMLGEIRLQWWRDAVATGAGGGHPIATALNATIVKCRLPKDAFRRLIDARLFDLYDDPMPSLNDLEGYAGETSSALFQLAAIVLAGGHDPGTADASGHAGVAYALTGLMRSLPVHARRGQLYLPVSMIATRGLDTRALFAGRSSPELITLLADLRTIARQHLAEAERDIADLTLPVKTAFLPLALVRAYLDRMDRPEYDPFEAPAELPPWRRQWILWRSARRM